MCILSVYTLLKVVGYYDFSFLSMSVIGFQKKFGWGGVGGWGELYPSFFLYFWNFFNFAKPLINAVRVVIYRVAALVAMNVL